VTAHGALTTTAFTYDEGGRLVYEVGSAGGTAYVYLDQVPVGVVTGGQLYYIETDQLGTPRQAATTNNGLRWSWDYFGTTFGETPPNENPSGLGAFTFNLRFPGQYYDVETGTHYNYFRDYEPQTGAVRAKRSRRTYGRESTRTHTRQVIRSQPLIRRLWQSGFAAVLQGVCRATTRMSGMTAVVVGHVEWSSFSVMATIPSNRRKVPTVVIHVERYRGAMVSKTTS
jgi:uncharacterized protein RhaS with RHS repeats